ncbi:MAG TPA: hypothetical protein PLU22_19795 [Polyangiaceae bacterium]|nr:hypothetical protein [Polyangiaceae bacterium]
MTQPTPASSPILPRERGQDVAIGCGGCAVCAGGERDGESAGAAPPFGGATLVGAAAFYFLFPLALALALALLAGSSTERRSFGALLGLAAGLGATVLVARRWTSRLEGAAARGPGDAAFASPERLREETDRG